MSKIIDCSEPWFSLIKQGVKPVEGRKGTPTWSSIKIGDLIIFRDPDDHKKTFEAKVTGINKYLKSVDSQDDPLDQYLKGETLEKALPGVKTLEEGRKVYLQWSTQAEIDKYGMLGIHVAL